MSTIIKFLFVTLCLLNHLTVHAAIYTATATGDLDSGTVTLTSTQTSPVTYLRQVAVNFVTAPEAAETITVTAMSSAGAAYDVILAKATTVAATTTSLTFIVGTPIQIDNTHQVRVHVTNASQSVSEVNDDPVANISALFDTVPPTGSEGVTVIRDGVLLASTRYPTILDEGSALVQRNQVNFTGDGVICTENATLSRTDCTVTNQYYATIQEEGAPLTQRLILNFVGTTITCADDTTKTTCTVTAPSYQTVMEDGTPLTQRPTINFAMGITCTDDAGNDRTNCSVP